MGLLEPAVRINESREVYRCGKVNLRNCLMATVIVFSRDDRELEAVPLRGDDGWLVISATCEIRLRMRTRCCRAACREAVSSISYYFRHLVPHNRLLARS